MNKYESKVIKAGAVDFPEFKGEKVYMHEFYMKDGLPSHLKRWQSTVDQMLKGIKTEGPIYLMVDQAFVPAGTSHRRPGLHIDGYWVASNSSHGGSSAGHNSEPSEKGGHSASGGHNSSPSEEEGWGHSGKPSKSSHLSLSSLNGGHDSHKSKSSLKGRHDSHKGHSKNSKNKSSWETSRFDVPEAIILASNVSAARAFDGEYVGPIKDMGSCEHICTTKLKEVSLEANTAYLGNVTFLHETLPVKKDCYRTVVRLNVPGFSF